MNNQTKRKYFIILLVVTIFSVVTAGYFSASLKTEPQYLSKIDKIMFDKENKSPKFILTLPDRETEKKVEEIQEKSRTEKADVLKTFDDLAALAPLISKLPEIKDQVPLNYIEIDEDLQEKVGNITLPKISDKGKKAWMEYGKTVDVTPNFSKVAIVIKNVGLDNNITNAVISALPSEISLSFSPYTIDAEEKIKKARKAGHETYLDLLLSSKDVLKSDNGPLSMSLTLSPEENLQRLHKVLSVNAPIGGLVVNDGIADNDTQKQLKTFVKELKNRGLLMVDSISNKEISNISEQGLARKKAEIVLDYDTLTPQSLEKKLNEAEKIARDNGQVTIVALPKPIIITAISNWIKTFSEQLTYQQMKERKITVFEKPFALVPISNLVVE